MNTGFRAACKDGRAPRAQGTPQEAGEGPETREPRLQGAFVYMYRMHLVDHIRCIVNSN